MRQAAAPVRMQADQKESTDDNKPESPLSAAGIKTKAQEQEDSVEQTWWGLASFVLIIAVMSLGIVATLARDFVPGGLGLPQ
jgi:hypothetical protein